MRIIYYMLRGLNKLYIYIYIHIYISQHIMPVAIIIIKIVILILIIILGSPTRTAISSILFTVKYSVLAQSWPGNNLKVQQQRDG